MNASEREKFETNLRLFAFVRPVFLLFSVLLPGLGATFAMIDNCLQIALKVFRAA